MNPHISTSLVSHWAEQYCSICDSSIREFAFDNFDDAHPVRGFTGYWQNLADGDVPERRLFSPADCQSVVKWLTIFERIVEDDGNLYRVRLQGGAVRELMHGDVTDNYLHEFTFGENFTCRREFMEKAVSGGKPLYGETAVKGSGGQTLVGIAMYPFIVRGTDGAEDKYQIFVVTSPQDPKGRMYL